MRQVQGRRQKNFQGRGDKRKKDRKIAKNENNTIKPLRGNSKKTKIGKKDENSTMGGFHVTSQCLCFRAKTELAE